MRALLACVLLVDAAVAVEIEREDYKIVGWNDACIVAVERYAYPKLGSAIYGEPVTTRIGTLAIVLDKPTVTTRWVLEAEGPDSWDKQRIESVRKDLQKAGYERPGFSETIRNAAMSNALGPREVILSTATLEARPDAWPGPQWRWGRTHYNPLTTCALLVFEKIGERDRFKFLLTRIYNTSVRAHRARAHTTNGRLLFNAGDMDGAVAEAEIGARLAPELGTTRYHYAAMLALSGRIDEAMAELTAAVAREARFAGKAGSDEDFDSLRMRQDFRDLVKKQSVKKRSK